MGEGLGTSDELSLVKSDEAGLDDEVKVIREDESAAINSDSLEEGCVLVDHEGETGGHDN